MVESKDVGIEAGGRLASLGDFRLIEVSIVPIEWIQKLYPDSWEKFTWNSKDVEQVDG